MFSQLLGEQTRRVLAATWLPKCFSFNFALDWILYSQDTWNWVDKFFDFSNEIKRAKFEWLKKDKDTFGRSHIAISIGSVHSCAQTRHKTNKSAQEQFPVTQRAWELGKIVVETLETANPLRVGRQTNMAATKVFNSPDIFTQRYNIRRLTSSPNNQKFENLYSI